SLVRGRGQQQDDQCGRSNSTCAIHFEYLLPQRNDAADEEPDEQRGGEYSSGSADRQVPSRPLVLASSAFEGLRQFSTQTVLVFGCPFHWLSPTTRLGPSASTRPAIQSRARLSKKSAGRLSVSMTHLP